MTRKFYIHLIHAALWASVILTGACGNDISDGIQQANDLMYRQQYVASERLFRQLYQQLQQSKNRSEQQDAMRVQILQRLGQINALYLHDYRRAIADYTILTKQFPRSDEAMAAYENIADIYHHKLGQPEAALHAYERLIDLFPKQPHAQHVYVDLIDAYWQLHNYEQVRKTAQAVVERWPDSEEAMQARFHQANAYYVEKRYSDAIALYELLLQEQTNAAAAAQVRFELGNCYQELGELQRALDTYYNCLADHPNPMLVQRKIKRVRHRLQRLAPVVGAFTKK